MPSTQATAISSLIDQFVLNYATPAFHNLELNRILHLMTLLADGGGGGTGGTWGAITGNITDQIDLTDYIAAQIAGSGSATWGNITGTLTDQADLVAYIAAQVGAVPTWDATLTAGINTGQAPTQTQNGTLGAGHLWWTWILKPDSGDPSSPYGTFNSFVDDSFVDGSGNRDHVFNYMSYNYPGTGVTPLAGEAAWRFGVERFYTNGLGNLFEFHIPEIKTTAGNLYRLMSIYANRDTGAAQFNFVSNTNLWFSDSDQDHEYALLDVNFTGEASLHLDSSYGSGGRSPGTATNQVSITMTAGSTIQAYFTCLADGQLTIYGYNTRLFGNTITTNNNWIFQDGDTPIDAGMMNMTCQAATGTHYGFQFKDASSNKMFGMYADGVICYNGFTSNLYAKFSQYYDGTTRLAAINFDPAHASADPTTLNEGDVWYNSTSKKWKGYDGTNTVTFTTIP